MLLFLLLLLWGWRYYRLSLKSSIGEDSYQLERRKKHNAYMYSYTKFSSPTDISQHLDRHLESYLETYPSIQKLYTETDQKNLISTFDTSKNLVSTSSSYKNPQIAHFSFNNLYDECLAIFNHYYLGGSFFVQTVNMFVKGDFGGLTKNSFRFPIRELYTLKFLLWRLFSRRPEKSFSLGKEISRYYQKLSVSQLKSSVGTKPSIIHRVLSDILRSSPHSSINLYLTFGFEHDPTVFNNVGVLFLEFNRETTLQQLEKDINSRKYQIIATNNLMNLFDSGKKTRDSIDVVFTSCYVTKSERKPEILSVSYSHAAEYPLYVFCASIEDDCHVTITSMTPDLSSQEILKKGYQPVSFFY